MNQKEKKKIEYQIFFLIFNFFKKKNGEQLIPCFTLKLNAGIPPSAIYLEYWPVYSEPPKL